MIVRYAFTGAAGFGITLGLFLLMQWLIGVAKEREQQPISAVSVDFIRSRDESATQLKERQLPPKPKQEATPEAPELKFDIPKPSLDSAGSMQLVLPKVEVQGNPFAGGAISDGEEQPLVRIEPTYPPRALSRGVEGWVLLEFTVTETGAVTDARVVDREPSGIFNSAALRAVSKWKYRPKVVNGKPLPREGVQIVLRFNLADEDKRR
jgi:periplasmic protein TonB